MEFSGKNTGVGFPGGILVKNPLAKAGDTRDSVLIPGLERSPGEGNGNPLQYSCLENPIDKGVWWAIVHGVAKRWTWPSMHTCQYWSGLPFPSPGDLPDPGMETESLTSPALAGVFFTTEPPGKHRRRHIHKHFYHHHTYGGKVLCHINIKMLLLKEENSKQQHVSTTAINRVWESLDS